jgi:hypothetical protein
VLLGYALLGRGFAYWGVPPFYVGEMALAIGILCLGTTGIAVALRLPLLIPLLLFMLWGAARTLPFTSEYGLDALRDAVLWGYGLFAIVVGASLLRSGKLDEVPRYYARTISCFLVIGPLLLLAGRFWGEDLPSFPGSPVPLFAPKFGDAAVHYAGIAAFLLLAVPGRPRSRLVPEAARAWIWALLWIGGVMIVASATRGGALAVLVALAIVAFARRALPQLASLFLLMLIGAATLAAFDVEIDLAGYRSISLDQLLTNLSTIAGGQSGDAFETKSWRLEWWRVITDYTFFGEHFWTGKGFGINLADDDGFQVVEEIPLRSPHSVHMTVLARMGVPGLVLWLVLQSGFALSLIVTARRVGRLGFEAWARLDYWLLAYWAAFIVNGSFDVYLEGPQGGIWFWSLFGCGMAALAAQRALLARESVRAEPILMPGTRNMRA